MSFLSLSFLSRHRDKGLLVLRLGIGIMFVIHGLSKLRGGPDVLTGIGSAMSLFGIESGHYYFGLAAALSEAIGGALLFFGLFTRLACAALLATMVVATISLVAKGDDFIKYSHALEAAILFAALVIIGPGRHSVDAKMGWASRQRAG